MTQDVSISPELIGQLIDGTIDNDNAQRLLRLERKDKGRFFQYIEALQQRVAWQEKILLRLGDKLYIVASAPGKRVVKCACGHEFGADASGSLRARNVPPTQLLSALGRCGPATAAAGASGRVVLRMEGPRAVLGAG